MENRELLYQAEYKVNELREQYVKEVKYTRLLTLRDVLDMGFDITYLKVKENDYINLGYKELGENAVYYSNDLGYLTDKQLDCKVLYDDYSITDENYSNIDVILANEEDYKLFMEV